MGSTSSSPSLARQACPEPTKAKPPALAAAMIARDAHIPGCYSKNPPYANSKKKSNQWQKWLNASSIVI
jgi:hypothetical protein